MYPIALRACSATVLPTKGRCSKNLPEKQQRNVAILVQIYSHHMFIFPLDGALSMRFFLSTALSQTLGGQRTGSWRVNHLPWVTNSPVMIAARPLVRAAAFDPFVPPVQP